MPPDEKDAACIWDMLNAAKEVRRFIRNITLDEYIGDKKLQRAIERSIEIIGEAARGISDEFKESHPEIPWRNIIGQRNILVHQYGKIKQDRMFNLATYDIDRLISQLENLIPPLPPKIEEE